jgi:translocation and assembly module TamB
MKKTWLALAAVVLFFLAACFSFWLERPALMNYLTTTVTTTLNEHVNGTVAFSSMDVSLTGKVTLADPVVKDLQGRTVITGKDIQVQISPWQALHLAVNGGSAAGSVETVSVDRPVVELWETTPGNWNILSLIKQSEDTSDPGFRAAIHIRNGIVRAKTLSGMTVRAEDCEGMLDFSDYPDLYAQLSLNVDGQAVTASGHYTSARQYDVKVRAEGLKAEYAAPFIPDTVQVAVQGGTIRNISAHIGQSHNGFILSGQADVQDGAATAYGYAVTALTGHLELRDDEVALQKITGKVNGQDVTVSGLIKINTGSPVFQLDIGAPALDVAAVVPAGVEVPISGTIGLQARLWGAADNLRAAGTVTLPDVDIQGLPVQDGKVDFEYGDKVVIINDLSAQVAGGQLSGRGSYVQETGDFSAAVVLDHIQLEQIPQIPVAVLGDVSGQLQAAGNSQSGAVQAQGTITAAGLSYNGLTTDTAQADFSYDNGLVTLAAAQLTVQGGTIQAGGTYDVNTGNSDISFSATNLPLQLFSAYANIPLAGTVSAAGHVWGNEPQWEASFHAQKGAVRNVLFDSVTGTAHGSGGQIVIPGVEWHYIDGLQTVSGNVNLDSRTVDLDLNTVNMRLERLLPLLGKGDLPLTGWVNNRVHVGGTLDNLSALGSVHLTEGSAYGYLYRNVSTDYRLDGGKVYLQNGDISAYDSHVQFHGTVGDTLAVYVESPDLDIARIEPGSKTHKQGYVNVSAYIGGTLDNPTAVGSVQSKHLVINDIAIDSVKADFGYYDGIVRVRDASFQQNGGIYDANASWKPSTGWITSRASVSNGDISSWIKLLNLPVKNVTGNIDGKISLDGTTQKPRGKIQGKITRATLAGYPVEPADIDVQLEDDVIKVNKLALKVDQGIVAAQGSYALHGPVKLQLGSRNFSSKIITSILDIKSVDLDTRIDSAVDISGTSSDPQMDISLQLNGGTMNGISFTNVYGLMNVRDGIIHINQAFLSRDPYKASAYGTIPISAISGDRTSDESMDVKIILENAGLDILAFMTPFVKEGDGGLDGSVNLQGTLARPQLKGTLSVHNGTIHFRDLQNPLENIDAALVFDGNKATLTSSGVMDKKGKKKKGSYTLNGTAQWEGWKLTSYTAALVLDKLAIDCNYYQGPLSGALSIEKGTDAPRLKGNIDISDTTLNVPLLGMASGSGPDLEMDFTLSLGKNVRLYNPVLYDLIVHGTVDFQGTVAHPMPTGQYKVIKGNIHYLDTKFIVTKGVADFSQADSFLPYLNVEAISSVGQHTIMLTLRGPASENMRLILRSEPPLTRQQIISLITLRNGGRNSSSLTGEDVSGLIGTGVRMTLNSLGVTNALEKAFSLDMLTITSGSLNVNERLSNENKNYYNIEMGKYLFNDFMLTAAFGLNHKDNRAGIRYDVTDRMSINAWKSKDDSFVGGQYRYSFY